MYDRVLIPTDGSAGTAQAVRRGLGLAQTVDAAVHVIYVVDTRPYGGIDHTDEESLEQNAIASGRQAITGIRERAAQLDLDFTQTIRTGIPHVEILDYTETNDIDLLVMGTHGRTGAESPVLGSTTDRILRETDVPVITVHSAGESDSTDVGELPAGGDILVPTDGSEAAVRAAEHATGIAEQYGATVHVLYVVDTGIFEFEDAPRSILGSLREGGQNAVSEIETMVTDASIPVKTTLSEGKPYQHILDYAAGINADLVVMGRRGRTGLPEVLLGSTTARVISLSNTPVLSLT